jgi:hypothetical protein
MESARNDKVSIRSRCATASSVLTSIGQPTTVDARVATADIQGERLDADKTTFDGSSVLHQGRIEKVFYPVFPPDKHGEQVRAWLDAKNKGLI